MSFPNKIKGRSANFNPSNRFEAHACEYDEGEQASWNAIKTEIIEDHSSSIITYNDSPDIPFDAGINPYRGCEHGCAYCYARPTHEYLGYSAGLDFESKIVVKKRAPQLLSEALSKASWKPQVLAMSGVTDCYQPVEKKLEITRGCLKVLLRFRNPVALITKNSLITRDIDLLRQFVPWRGVAVNISITSLDPFFVRSVEPRTSSPHQRVEAVRALAHAGIPVGVIIAPVIPGLNETEIPAIIEAAAEAGATWVNAVPLRLPYGVKDLFVDWLKRTYPSKQERVIERVMSLRGGRLNDPRLGTRMRGEGIWAEQIRNLVRLGKQRSGLQSRSPDLNTESFLPLGGKQLELF